MSAIPGTLALGSIDGGEPSAPEAQAGHELLTALERHPLPQPHPHALQLPLAPSPAPLPRPLPSPAPSPNPDADAGPATGPSPAVLAALDAQTTPEMIARAIKFATWQRDNLLLRRVEYVEPASDQVVAVLLQIREGTLSWEPARCSLYKFVCGVVETRCRRLLRRGRERSFDAMIDGRSGDGSDAAAEYAAAAIEEALVRQRGPATTPDVALDRARVLDRFVVAMGTLVARREDPDLTRAFQAWIDLAAISEADVARATGMSPARARRAVRILRSLLDELPAALCSQIEEVLS